MAAKMEDQSMELYERCSTAGLRSKEGRAKVFSQDELLAMGVVETSAALLGLAQDLMDSQLFRLMQMDGKICYALRTREDATKYVSLSMSESPGCMGITTQPKHFVAAIRWNQSMRFHCRD